MWWETPAGVRTRVMLGTTSANKFGQFSSEPDTVGLYAFDWLGHIVRLPNQSGDNPVPIYPETWYAVEFMTHYDGSNVTVKLWIDGVLQMTRTEAASGDPQWENGNWDLIQDTAWFGGANSCNLLTEEQFVYRDNAVVSKSYIGPIGELIGNTPVPPTILGN